MHIEFPVSENLPELELIDENEEAEIVNSLELYRQRSARGAIWALTGFALAAALENTPQNFVHDDTQVWLAGEIARVFGCVGLIKLSFNLLLTGYLQEE